jgi:predicted transcriptional regulator
MEKSELLNLETRRKIYNYVKDNPGLHLHELARKLNVKYNNLRYHLRYLEKNEMIVIKTSDSYSRVYSNQVCTIDKELLNIIRKDTPCYIIFLLYMYGVGSQRDFSDNLDLHKTTIEYHLKKLLNKKIIEPAKNEGSNINLNSKISKIANRIPKKNEIFYKLTDPVAINKIFIMNKKSLKQDKFFKTGFNWLSEAVSTYGVPEKRSGMDKYIDLAIDAILDTFPVPFCA